MAANNIKIDEKVNKFEDIAHTWTGKNDFSTSSSSTLVKSQTIDNISHNAASTKFVQNKLQNFKPNNEQNIVNIPLLTPMLIDYKIDDNSWVISNSSSWEYNNNGVITNLSYTKNDYADIYDHLCKDVDDTTSKISTISIDGEEYSFILASDGHRILLNETTYKPGLIFDKLYNDPRYMAFWFFILDKKDEKFGLPKSKAWFRCTSSTDVGVMYKGGLPNITGSFSILGDANIDTVSGAFTKSSYSTNKKYSDDKIFTSIVSNIDFDASRSSNIYGDDIDTVTVPSVGMFLYFSTGINSNRSSSATTHYYTGVVDGTISNSYSFDPTKNVDNSTYKKIYTIKSSSFVNLQTTDCKCDIDVWINKDIKSNIYAGRLYTENSNGFGVLSLGYLQTGTSVWVKVNGAESISSDITPSATINEYTLNTTTNDSVGRIENKKEYNTKTATTTTFTATSNGVLVIDVHGIAPEGFYVKVDGETLISGNKTYQSVSLYQITTGTVVEWIRNVDSAFDCYLYEYNYKSNHIDCQSYITSSYTTDNGIHVDLYSDGWCEQRGKIRYSQTTQFKELTAGFTANFELAFTEEPYYIGVQTSMIPSETGNYSKLGALIKTTSLDGFTYTFGITADSVASTYATNDYYDYWEACGYINR